MLFFLLLLLCKDAEGAHWQKLTLPTEVKRGIITVDIQVCGGVRNYVNQLQLNKGNGGRKKQTRCRHKIKKSQEGEIADREIGWDAVVGGRAEVAVSSNRALSYTFRSVHFRAARSVTFDLTPDNLDPLLDATERCLESLYQHRPTREESVYLHCERQTLWKVCSPDPDTDTPTSMEFSLWVCV